MRTASIQTNQTCNHRCGFCHSRRAHERARVAAAQAVRSRIDAALSGRARVLVLTGGEPLMRRDVAAIIAYCKARGSERVELESNGSLLDSARAAELAAAGLDCVRLHVPAWSARADVITGAPGSFVAVRSAMTALADAGIAIEVAVPIVRANLAEVAAIPAALVERGVEVAALVAAVPLQCPEPDSLASVGAATRALAALAAAATAADLPLRIHPETFLPPCSFADPAAVAHLYTLSRGGAGRGDCRQELACATCLVADRCPGVAEALRARAGGFAVVPISDDYLRRRLSNQVSVAAQVARELVSREIYRRDNGTINAAQTVRVGFACNQRCKFCFVSTHLPGPPRAAVRAAIAGAARAAGPVVLSGGEPTLVADLVELVALARAEGAETIELQSNAVRLGGGALLGELEAAGLTDVLVSLHGPTAEISDAITGAPGSFAKTVAGIDALAASSLHVRLNFVFCQLNRGSFSDLVTLVAERWPRLSLTVSFIANSTDLVPRTRAMTPRYRDIVGDLAAGMAKARAAAIEVLGLDSMCGLPLCLVPAELASFFALAELPSGFDRGEFVKSGGCDSCRLSPRCFGLRRGYVELYGCDELEPVPQGGSGTTASS